MEYVLSNIEKGIFYPQVPISSLVLFISSFIDGIAQSVATAMEKDDLENITIMFQILAKAVIGFLEE